MTNRSKKIVVLIIVLAIIGLSVLGVFVVFPLIYPFHKTHSGEYKEFSSIDALEKSMNKYYNVKVPRLKEMTDLEVEPLERYYQTDFVYTVKDVLFNQKTMRKNAITSYSVMFRNIKYSVIIVITADFYDIGKEVPTVVEEGIYKTEEDEILPKLSLENDHTEYRAEVAYNCTRYIIKISPYRSQYEEYQENASLIKDYVVEALND